MAWRAEESSTRHGRLGWKGRNITVRNCIVCMAVISIQRNGQGSDNHRKVPATVARHDRRFGSAAHSMRLRGDLTLPRKLDGPTLLGRENTSTGFETCAEIGYRRGGHCIPASAIGAPHRRDRIWIVANASERRCGRANGWQMEQPRRTETIGTSEDVADAARNVRPNKRRAGPSGNELGRAVNQSLWPTPTVQDASNNGGASQYERNSLPLNAVIGGALNPQFVSWLMGFPIDWCDMTDELPRSSRQIELRALGNAVIPQIPELIGRAIINGVK